MFIRSKHKGRRFVPFREEIEIEEKLAGRKSKESSSPDGERGSGGQICHGMGLEKFMLISLNFSLWSGLWGRVAGHSAFPDARPTSLSLLQTRNIPGLRRLLRSLFRSRTHLPMLVALYLLALHVLLFLCFTGHL